MTSLRPRDRLWLAAIAVFGAFALVQHWMTARRPDAPEQRVGRELVVSSGEDRGEGSLREAILAADSAPTRTRIVLRTASIRLRSPLPPLVNPKGIVIDGEAAATAIDLSAIGSGVGLEIRGTHSQVRGVSFTGARGIAMLAAAPDFTLHGARFSDCAEALRLASPADNTSIERSLFERNGIGIRAEGPRGSTSVRNNRFLAHRDAAIWAVQPDGAPTGELAVDITSNHFDGDHRSIVAANARVLVEKNEFLGIRDTAVLALGPGPTVRDNQMRDGRGMGVVLHGAVRAVVEGNEIMRNQALGVLVRDSGGATLRANRVYGNGYGMAFVLGDGARPVTASQNAVLNQRHDGIIVIGDSPVLQRNQALHNGQAGLRVLDVRTRERHIAAAPFLEGNTLAGNLVNQVVRGDYRTETQEPAR